MTAALKAVKREYERLRWLAFPGRMRAMMRRVSSSPKSKARRKIYEATLEFKARRKIANASPASRRSQHQYKVSVRGRRLRRELQRGEAYKIGARRRDRGRAVFRNALRRCRCDFQKIAGAQRAAIEKTYARAQELRQWFDVVVDHIIPLSKGGAHSPENLQIIYRFENATKGARLDYKPSVVFT